ncbi:vesicle coat component, partial [Ascosphaera aggregata]
MTGAPMARSAQSSARSKYSPHPLQPEQSQIQGQAAITPQQPGFVPTGRSPHARIPSRLEKDPSVNVATVRLAPPPFTATSRVPSPASIVPQVAAQHMPLSREDSVTRATFTELNYIVPDDGQESDPLQRWRGAPILKFGFGGLTCSTFPKLVPKYLTGHALPKMKPIPGEIQIRKAGDIVPSALLPTESAGFPGPLSSKSKKNDVIAWMTQIIAQIQERGGDDEEALLWKVVRLLLEHDGVLNGAPAVLDAVCTLIFPKELSDSHKTVVAAAEKAVSPDDQA